MQAQTELALWIPRKPAGLVFALRTLRQNPLSVKPTGCNPWAWRLLWQYHRGFVSKSLFVRRPSGNCTYDQSKKSKYLGLIIVLAGSCLSGRT
jgi:hypothetical protein